MLSEAESVGLTYVEITTDAEDVAHDEQQSSLGNVQASTLIC